MQALVVGIEVLGRGIGRETAAHDRVSIDRQLQLVVIDVVFTAESYNFV